MLQTFKDIGDKIIIDAGGFIGDSILVFRECTKNKIYSFEPDSKNYKLALETISLNSIQDVVLENIALGDKAGEFPMSSYAGSAIGGGSSLALAYKKYTETETVKVETLDNYVKKHSLKVGLIKVDIEGSEQTFLRGALETIKEQKPAMLISLYHTYDDFCKIKPFLESLNLGYKFDFFKGPDRNCHLDVMLLCEVR